MPKPVPRGMPLTKKHMRYNHYSNYRKLLRADYRKSRRKRPYRSRNNTHFNLGINPLLHANIYPSQNLQQNINNPLTQGPNQGSNQGPNQGYTQSAWWNNIPPANSIQGYTPSIQGYTPSIQGYTPGWWNKIPIVKSNNGRPQLGLNTTKRNTGANGKRRIIVG